MHSPYGCVGFNFNFFSIAKLIQHVCVKFLRHSVLFLKSIDQSRINSRQKSVAFFPIQYDTISLYCAIRVMSHRVEVEDEAEQVRTGLLLLSLNHTRESSRGVD